MGFTWPRTVVSSSRSQNVDYMLVYVVIIKIYYHCICMCFMSLVCFGKKPKSWPMNNIFTAQHLRLNLTGFTFIFICNIPGGICGLIMMLILSGLFLLKRIHVFLNWMWAIGCFREQMTRHCLKSFRYGHIIPQRIVQVTIMQVYIGIIHMWRLHINKI